MRRHPLLAILRALSHPHPELSLQYGHALVRHRHTLGNLQSQTPYTVTSRVRTLALSTWTVACVLFMALRGRMFARQSTTLLGPGGLKPVC
jgi:hypothetical protein